MRRVTVRVASAVVLIVVVLVMGPCSVGMASSLNPPVLPNSHNVKDGEAVFGSSPLFESVVVEPSASLPDEKPWDFNLTPFVFDFNGNVSGMVAPSESAEDDPVDVSSPAAPPVAPSSVVVSMSTVKRPQPSPGLTASGDSRWLAGVSTNVGVERVVWYTWMTSVAVLTSICMFSFEWTLYLV
jgi:hypothetical protein